MFESDGVCCLKVVTSIPMEGGVEPTHSKALECRGSTRPSISVETGRFRRFTAQDIAERSYHIDITWLKDDSLENSDELPDPQDLATEAITELEAIVGDLREIVALVEAKEGVEV